MEVLSPSGSLHLQLADMLVLSVPNVIVVFNPFVPLPARLLHSPLTFISSHQQINPTTGLPVVALL